MAEAVPPLFPDALEPLPACPRPGLASPSSAKLRCQINTLRFIDHKQRLIYLKILYINQGFEKFPPESGSEARF